MECASRGGIMAGADIAAGMQGGRAVERVENGAEDTNCR